MPRVHRCAQPFCQAVIGIEQRYCQQHAPEHQRFAQQSRQDKLQANKEYNQYQRDPIANAFYHSKAWQSVSAYVKARDLYADAVTERVVADGNLIVDHLVPRRLLTRQEALDPTNLWCLSRQHHNIKTRIEQSIAKQPKGDTKLKHLKREWWVKVIKEKSKPTHR